MIVALELGIDLNGETLKGVKIHILIDKLELKQVSLSLETNKEGCNHPLLLIEGWYILGYLCIAAAAKTDIF